jgi:hypothetical protein
MVRKSTLPSGALWEKILEVQREPNIRRFSSLGIRNPNPLISRFIIFLSKPSPTTVAGANSKRSRTVASPSSIKERDDEASQAGVATTTQFESRSSALEKDSLNPSEVIPIFFKSAFKWICPRKRSAIASGRTANPLSKEVNFLKD